MSKRPFFGKTARRRLASGAGSNTPIAVVVIDDDDGDDNNDDDNNDDDDATVPLSSDSESSIVAELSQVPWHCVIEWLELADIVCLGQTCRFLHARVRADVREIDLVAMRAARRAAAIRFASQCTALRMVRCVLSQVVSAVACINVHKVVVEVDQIVSLQSSIIAWAGVKELTVSNFNTPIHVPALRWILSSCTNLLRLETHSPAFPLAQLRAMPTLVQLSLSAYTRTYSSWAKLWKLLPALHSLSVAQGLMPVDQLPAGLRSLSVCATMTKDLIDHADLSVRLARQIEIVQAQCKRLFSLELTLTVTENASLLVLQTLNALTRLPHLEHLVLRFRAERFEPHFAHDEVAQFRDALARCRARSTSLWHVELSTAMRFSARRVYQLGDR
jgi:hypothetical protein